MKQCAVCKKVRARTSWNLADSEVWICATCAVVQIPKWIGTVVAEEFKAAGQRVTRARLDKIADMIAEQFCWGAFCSSENEWLPEVRVDKTLPPGK